MPGTNCAQFRVGKVRILDTLGPAQEAGPPPSVRLSNQNSGINFGSAVLRFSPSAPQQVRELLHRIRQTFLKWVFFVLTPTLCEPFACHVFRRRAQNPAFHFLPFSKVPFAAPPICPYALIAHFARSCLTNAYDRRSYSEFIPNLGGG